MRIEVLFTHLSLSFFDWGLGTTASSPAQMGLTTRVGVQTHLRPSNYDGPWLYFENYGNIAPLTARYLPNSYGIISFPS